MTDKELLELADRLQDFALAEGCPTAAMRDAAAILRKLAEQEPCAWRHSKTGRLSDMEGGLSLADGDEWAEPLYAAPMPKEQAT